MRIIFLGSPSPVLPVVRALYNLKQNGGIHELIAIVSQPAKPSGRGRQLSDPAVASWAKTTDLPVFQYSRINEPDNLNALRELKPDLFITAAYGQILGDEFLSIPRRGTINIHPSLLPQYRGATPVASAILSGDKVTGVSVLFTVKKLDAGNIVAQISHPLLYDKGCEALTEELFLISIPVLISCLDTLAHEPHFLGTPQDEALVTHGKKIKKEDGEIDWNEAAEMIFRKSLAYDPWPGIYTFHKGNRVVLSQCFLPDIKNSASDIGQTPGCFAYDKQQKSLLIKTGSGILGCREIKPQGQRKMDAQSFINGMRDKSQHSFSG